MKTRIDAGTDVAMIGAWDHSRNDCVLANVPFKAIMKTLNEDAQAGHLFLIHTGADGGGPIDVYVEESLPESALKQTRPAEGEFLIRVPTGRLVVGGAEDYRTLKPRITAQNSIVFLPAGDYRLRCHIGTEDEWAPEKPSKAEMNAPAPSQANEPRTSFSRGGKRRQPGAQSRRGLAKGGATRPAGIVLMSIPNTL